MDQSDYSFMRSGFDNLENGDDEQKQQQLASTLVHFSENALLNASVYIKHADRNQITKEDLKRCLMLEVFIFTKRENLQEKIEDIVEELYYNDSDEEDVIFDDLQGCLYLIWQGTIDVFLVNQLVGDLISSVVGKGDQCVLQVPLWIDAEYQKSSHGCVPFFGEDVSVLQQVNFFVQIHLRDRYVIALKILLQHCLI